MPTALYGEGREAFANGDIDWLTDDIRVILVDTALYTVNIDVDDFRSDIAGGAQLATSGALTGKTNVLGVLDAADVVFPNLSLATAVDALVIYKHTGISTTDRLIAYIDNAPELPASTTGGDFTITWDAGANKIVKI